MRLAGTTNRNDFLTDDTGGRRFWPVVVGAVDLDAFTRNRSQLWAEAVALFSGGERWWLDHEDEGSAKEVVASRSADDPWTANVLQAVEGITGPSTRDVFQMLDVPYDRRVRSDAMDGDTKRKPTVAEWMRAAEMLARTLLPDLAATTISAPNGNCAPLCLHADKRGPGFA